MKAVYSNTDTRRARRLFEHNRHLSLKGKVEDKSQQTQALRHPVTTYPYKMAVC